MGKSADERQRRISGIEERRASQDSRLSSKDAAERRASQDLSRLSSKDAAETLEIPDDVSLSRRASKQRATLSLARPNGLSVLGKSHKGPTDVAALAHMWNLPLDTVTEASVLFIQFATLQGYTEKQDALRDGFLDSQAMARIVATLEENTGMDEFSATPGEIMGLMADVTTSDTKVDFQEFTCWYNERAFTEYVNLSKSELEVRRVGTRLGITAGDMDQYKANFDKFDTNKSGQIDPHEFAELLQILMKIPKGHSLPQTRIDHFWKECDLTCNGTVDLFEFVTFYVKHFDIHSEHPMEDYYSSFRRCSAYPHH